MTTGFFQTRQGIARATAMIMTSATANLASGDIFKGCQFQQHWYVEVIEADLKPAVIRTYEHQTVP